MDKRLLLAIPFSIGLTLLFFSWYLSYPLSINAINEFTFNYISILYWASIPLLLVPLYLTAMNTKNSNIKWIVSVAIVLVLYSISYFYLMLPGSDSHYFRGMTENVEQTRNINPLQPNKSYFQWPAFFLFSYIASSASGLGIPNFEFILYTIIGFLIAISLHFYASNSYKNNGFLLIIVFFISMFYFLNYQNVPFSLALALLFLIFMLETHPKNKGITITIEILFIGIVLTHAFVPLFFIIYLVFRTILDRSKYYAQLLLFALSLFFIIQLTIAQDAFATHIMLLLSRSNEYSSIIEATATTATIPIDEIAQIFSRTTTFIAMGVSGIGFLFLLIKRKMRNVDKALLLTGSLYTGLGVFFAALGSRALILAFIPVALGAVYLFESKTKPIIKKFFSLALIIAMVLFLFIPLHLSFNNAIHYQTQEAYKAENFFIENMNWQRTPFVFAYSSVTPYIESKVQGVAYITFYLGEAENVDAMLYTMGLGKDLMSYNYTAQKIIHEKDFSVFYNNGFSLIAADSGEI